ncbi:hypothetical protein HZB00_00615, partial [Candidatus Woesearchaeota archaeon]|nr:hypothetical protein [Candidatus Woesearchaeota archaeon]
MTTLWQKKSLFLLFLVILSTAPFVFADTLNASSSGFDVSKGYNWLFNETSSSTRTLSLQERDLATLTLVSQGGRDVSGLVDRILKSEDSQHCWPSGSCTVLDTSYSYLLLSKTGKDLTATKAWLQSSLLAGLKTGEWRIQLQTSGNITGTCTASWNGKTKDFTVQGTEFKTSRKYYLSVGSDLDSSLLQKPQQKFTVDCSKISGGDVSLSFVYAK